MTDYELEILLDSEGITIEDVGGCFVVNAESGTYGLGALDHGAALREAAEMFNIEVD